MSTWTGTLLSLLTGNKITGSKLATWHDILAALTDQWSTYVPVWASSGTAVSLGNGTITGSYQQTGKRVSGRITLTMGSTTTFGTGNYSVTLPVAMAGATWDSFASLTVRDASATVTYSYGAFATSTTTASGGSNADVRWGPTNPITFAVGDVVTISFEYEAA